MTDPSRVSVVSSGEKGCDGARERERGKGKESERETEVGTELFGIGDVNLQYRKISKRLLILGS